MKMPVGSNMDIEKTVENYFGDVLGRGPSIVDESELERFGERYDDASVDEYLGLEEEINQGVVFSDGEEAVYVSDIKVVEGDIYLNFEDPGTEKEMIHGLARRFIDYSEPEPGDWEDGLF